MAPFQRNDRKALRLRPLSRDQAPGAREVHCRLPSTPEVPICRGDCCQ
jgi:hypothetical protein